jgi:AAT family amino acid transporter
MSVDRAVPGSAEPNQGLERQLSQRQLTMMAIGGAIGVGLFLGSTLTIQLAGPGVIITYLIGAFVAMLMAYAIAEMAVVHPVAGAFGIYAEKYVSSWAGFSVRATYGFVQILAIGAEVTAAAIYFGYWWPSVAPWIWVASVSLGLVIINSAAVGNFGEFEYWFALIKVVAIIAFICVGVVLIVGLTPKPAVGLSNLTAHGGFLPHGWRGVWLALTIAISSYMGLEVTAVTAGEAKNPEVTIPRAMRTVAVRLILFYVLAIAVMLAISPWNETTGKDITGSPFVRVFATAGIPYAATLMNLVVITAALSSANTNLYLTTRMLFSLSRGNYAPAWLSVVSANGVPRRALAVSTAGMVVAILLAIYAPKNAFQQLYGTAVAGMFFVWVVILLAHLGFRGSVSAERIAQLPLRVPFHPYSSIAGIVLLLAIVGTTFWIPDLKYTIPAFSVFLALITLAYGRARRAGAGRGQVVPD